MKAVPSLAAFALVMALAACQSPPTNKGPAVMTGAAGTTLEAERVVQLVYGQQPDSAISLLPYSGGDIGPTVKRMRARLPELKPLLESGVLGLGAKGNLLAREPASLQPAQAVLMKAENLDRTILYRASMFDTGHQDDPNIEWIHYTSAEFAGQWVAQAPAGWWVQDERGQWQRKAETKVN